MGPTRTKSQVEQEAAAALAASIPRENVLRYSIVQQLLWGTVGGKALSPVKAPSGGGQTGVGPKASLTYGQLNPGKATKGHDPDERGGAIMPGWWIVVPEKLDKGEQSSHTEWGGAPTGNSLRVLPYKLEGVGAGSTRSSFYIHGTGGRGSDGCILVAPGNRAALVKAVIDGNGAWLHAFLSGLELNNALEASDRSNRTG